MARSVIGWWADFGGALHGPGCRAAVLQQLLEQLDGLDVALNAADLSAGGQGARVDELLGVDAEVVAVANRALDLLLRFGRRRGRAYFGAGTSIIPCSLLSSIQASAGVGGGLSRASCSCSGVSGFFV